MTVSDDPRSPSSRVDDLPRILDAMTRAVRQALLAHKRAGNAVPVWRNGRVQWLQPDEILADDNTADPAGS